jgi:hypothetical protein
MSGYIPSVCSPMNLDLRTLRRLLLATTAILWSVGVLRAELQFVGVMSGTNGDLFAIRPAKDQPAQWVLKGGAVAGFVVDSYDAGNEVLQLRRGVETLTLRLPTAKVKTMARDEILVGMSKLLNLPAPNTVLDLIHPRLQAKFRDTNISSQMYEDVTRPEVSRGIRALTEKESSALAVQLNDLEKAIGVRPIHAFWTQNARSFSLTFVVQSAGSWYLAPSADPDVPVLSKNQPPPPRS